MPHSAILNSSGSVMSCLLNSDLGFIIRSIDSCGNFMARNILLTPYATSNRFVIGFIQFPVVDFICFDWKSSTTVVIAAESTLSVLISQSVYWPSFRLTSLWTGLLIVF